MTVSSDIVNDEQLMPRQGFKFPGERPRRHVAIGNGEKEAAAKQPLSAKLTPILAQVDALQRERDQYADDLRTANARIEQFESRVTELASQVESERARTAAAKEEAEQARAEQVRLETVLSGILNQANDALQR